MARGVAAEFLLTAGLPNSSICPLRHCLRPELLLPLASAAITWMQAALPWTPLRAWRGDHAAGF